MPSEYAIHDCFSMKSDVFNFGIIIFEIVSGKKNREFSDPERYLNLLGHVIHLYIFEWLNHNIFNLIN